MYEAYPDVKQATLAFAQLLRNEGLNVGIAESMEMLEAADSQLFQDKQLLSHAWKSISAHSKEEGVAFEELFQKFWQKDKRINRGKVTRKGVLKRTNTPASIVMLGMGEGQDGKEESHETSGANQVERLRKTDFMRLTQIDSEYLEELAKKLWKQMSLRIKRRMKSSEKQGLFDLRKTIRRSLEQGGDPIKPVFKTKRKRKQRLVIMLDVSGSMDKYSFFLLRFVCALKEHFERIEAFLFSTRLVCISDHLDASDLAKTLLILSEQANNWSSGTVIGECFHDFNENHAKRCLAGQSTVVILSDGLDTGKPELLAEELNKIRLRTSKVIWLNPLKGMEGYAPTARGMEAALPHLDVFQSAHNLDSLLELEQLLINV